MEVWHSNPLLSTISALAAGRNQAGGNKDHRGRGSVKGRVCLYKVYRVSGEMLSNGAGYPSGIKASTA